MGCFNLKQGWLPVQAVNVVLQDPVVFRCLSQGRVLMRWSYTSGWRYNLVVERYKYFFVVIST